MTQHRQQNPSLAELAGLATPLAIRVAATLRIADHLTAGPRTAAALADEVAADPDTLGRLLRHLRAVGVLYEDGERGYGLTALGAELREDHPGGLRPRLDMNGAEGRADLSFVRFLHTVRTARPAFDAHYGRGFWEDTLADPSRAGAFNHRMGLAITAEAAAITAAYDWGALGRVADVGGGNGALLTALLRGHPRLRGTVVDLPEVGQAARAALDAAGLADRAEFVVGNFFERLPVDGGACVLSAVLHNWGDAESLVILRRCAEAVGPGGRVFVIEKIGPDGVSPDTEADLHMAAYFGSGARERAVTEIGALADEAGLDTVAVHPAGASAVVELAVRPLS
ncbi:methyltransferase [Streptomyces eurocidicus]|uniref:Methyltransferase n=1 Tax=Streptomyces eurocidicus TaxID=66423 RepID=A0A2N8P0E0_STREU|nr:methyltransferase [Streptomyces eurocidicus]MBB5121688.1 SAM-dependent methyltransferase [Streptomyces eurocidicus]MBF6052912.1 methyltransferase [Streptomyces eurocidicus]PNE34486.1 methyltransferase [Streptomyces eurocidicus]